LRNTQFGFFLPEIEKLKNIYNSTSKERETEKEKELDEKEKLLNQKIEEINGKEEGYKEIKEQIKAKAEYLNDKEKEIIEKVNAYDEIYQKKAEDIMEKEEEIKEREENIRIQIEKIKEKKRSMDEKDGIIREKELLLDKEIEQKNNYKNNIYIIKVNSLEYKGNEANKVNKVNKVDKVNNFNEFKIEHENIYQIITQDNNINHETNNDYGNDNEINQNFDKLNLVNNAILDNYLNTVNIGYNYVLSQYENEKEFHKEEIMDYNIECEPIPSFVLCLQKSKSIDYNYEGTQN
jgi:DNA repair exonuclease SbcCD ATPase subunit